MSDSFGSGTIASDKDRDGSIFIAALAGLVAAIIGGSIWAVVAIFATAQWSVLPIGLMGIAVGAIVGFSIRLATNGRSAIFGIIGAVMALAGCLGGETVTSIQGQTTTTQDFYAVAKGLDFSTYIPGVISHIGVMTWVGIGIAAYEGWALSRHKS